MDQFFAKEKLNLLGNPVRQNIEFNRATRSEGLAHFGVGSGKTILIIGGSLGARTINQSINSGVEKLKAAGINIIWQTGKFFYPEAKKQESETVKVFDFIREMDLAYAAADLVVSRAGALSISELCAGGKAAILVPSPNVAEDHQTKNAVSMIKKEAAIMVKDVDASASLVNTMIKSIGDQALLESLSIAAKGMHLPLAAENIVKEIYKSIET